jgi:hypothetical protein
MTDLLPGSAPPSVDPASPPKAKAPTARGAALKIAAGIVGALIGYTAVKLLSHDLGLRIFVGGSVGLLIGLVPFLIGRKKHPHLARISLGCCLVAGMILGLTLALPLAAVFACIILAKKVNAPPGA